MNASGADGGTGPVRPSPTRASRIAPTTEQIAALRRDVDAAVELIGASLATSTRGVYARAWAGYLGWCARVGLEPVPANDAMLAAWVGSMRQLSPSTVRLRLAAVRLMHDGAR